MEKESSDLNWSEVKRWAWVVVASGVFGLFYYWVLVYAVAHTRQGNLILAVLTAVGALGIYAAFAGTNEFYGRRKRSRYRYGRFVAPIVVLLVVSHVVGAFMPTPQLQSYFVFAPLVLFTAAVLALVLIAWLKSFQRD